MFILYKESGFPLAGFCFRHLAYYEEPWRCDSPRWLKFVICGEHAERIFKRVVGCDTQGMYGNPSL